MKKEAIFHRQDLAKRLADELVSEDGTSGLFVTAPRRTGKSTFIREDLIPVLKSVHGAEVVYADLWEDRAANPGDVIVGAIKTRLLEFDGLLMRAAKASGVDKIKLGGLELSLDRLGFGKGETLTKALRILAQASKKPLVMVIDEAQHTQSSEEGRQALYALKAARDALNAGDGPGFRLLATGSNTDKLATLVEDKDQAFYQAPLIALEPLGRAYLEWVRGRLAFDPKPSTDALERVFQMCSQRPEPLKKALRELAQSGPVDAASVDALFEQLMARNLARARAGFVQQVNGLSPLDGAVLKVMAREGARFSPYAKPSIDAYQGLIAALGADDAVRVDNSSVQQALERLRDLQMVWRSGRGAYAIEDSQHIGWLSEEGAFDEHAPAVLNSSSH